jgi:hypothetical protein
MSIAEQFLLAHEGTFPFSARFLSELNFIAAGLAGAFGGERHPFPAESRLGWVIRSQVGPRRYLSLGRR